MVFSFLESRNFNSWSKIRKKEVRHLNGANHFLLWNSRKAVSHLRLHLRECLRVVLIRFRRFVRYSLLVWRSIHSILCFMRSNSFLVWSRMSFNPSNVRVCGIIMLCAILFPFLQFFFQTIQCFLQMHNTSLNFSDAVI